jgi:hypothetical protein
MPRVRRGARDRAPNIERLLSEAISFVIALRLMGTALVTLDNDHGRGVLATSWEVSKRLDVLKRFLRSRKARRIGYTRDS